MINTVINDVRLGYVIDEAAFSTHPNFKMGAAIKGRLQREGGVEVYFNTYAIFDTKQDDRFAFTELSGLNFFILSRSELDVTRDNFHDLNKRGVKISDIDSSVKNQLVSEILAEIGYNQYTLSHTKEVVLKINQVAEEAKQVAEEPKAVVIANGLNSEAYKALRKKKDEYGNIQKDIKAKQKDAAEAKKQWEAAEQAAEAAKRSYYDIERNIQGMFMDAMGTGEQLTQLSIAHAKEG